MTSRKSEFWKQLQAAKILVREGTAEADLRRGNPMRQAQPLPGEGSGPMERADVCVLDARGGHRQLGHRCPHFGPDFDRDHVETVYF